MHKDVIEPIRTACGAAYPQGPRDLINSPDKKSTLWSGSTVDSDALDQEQLKKSLITVPEWLWEWLTKDVVGDNTGGMTSTTYRNLLQVRAMMDLTSAKEVTELQTFVQDLESEILDARSQVLNNATVAMVPSLLKDKMSNWKGDNGLNTDFTTGSSFRAWALLPAYVLMDMVLIKTMPDSSCVFSALVSAYLFPGNSLVRETTYYELIGDVRNPKVDLSGDLLQKLPLKPTRCVPNFPMVVATMRNEIESNSTKFKKTTMNLFQTLLDETRPHGARILQQGVREAVVNRLVEQGGFGTPMQSWATELYTAQNREIKSHPLALELAIQRLTTAFIDQYDAFNTGEEKSVIDTVKSMNDSVMSMTGGKNSPFERQRHGILEGLSAEIDAVHAPAVLAGIRRAEATAQEAAQEAANVRHQLAEASRTIANGVSANQMNDCPDVKPVAYRPPPADEK